MIVATIVIAVVALGLAALALGIALRVLFEVRG